MNLIIRGKRGSMFDRNLVVFSVDDGEQWANLPLYLDEVNHSPTGFEWGYWGSGPAQLSYAVLRTFFRVVYGDDSKDTARQLYQQFKQDVIGAIQTEEWELTSDVINNWFQKYKQSV